MLDPSTAKSLATREHGRVVGRIQRVGRMLVAIGCCCLAALGSGRQARTVIFHRIEVFIGQCLTNVPSHPFPHLDLRISGRSFG